MNEAVEAQDLASGFHSLDDKEYFDLPYESNTGLGYFKRSPAHYAQFMSEGFKSTPDMVTGTLVHLYLFQPSVFAQLVAVGPVGVENKSLKAWKEFVAENEGAQYFVKASEMAEISSMAFSVFEHPEYDELVKYNGCEYEKVLVWGCPNTQQRCKGKLDVLHPEGEFVLDLKTTQSADPEEFSRHAFRYGYHRQAAMYCLGYEAITGKRPDRYFIAAVEKSPPYVCSMFEMDPIFIDMGLEEVLTLLEKLKIYKEQLKAGDVPCMGYGTRLMLQAPHWEVRKYMGGEF